MAGKNERRAVFDVRSMDREALHNEVIHLSYAMVADPSHLGTLSRLVFGRVEDLHAQDNETLSNPPVVRFERFDEWRVHMNNALGLLEQQARKGVRRNSLVEELSAEPAPAMLVDQTGCVLHANAEALSLPKVAMGAALAPESFSGDGYAELRSSLSELFLGDYRAGTCIVEMARPTVDGADRWLQVALSAEAQADERPIGKFSAVEAVWTDPVGRDFQKAFRLTPVEFEIVRAIMLGTPLAELASRRRRSVGTVRLQTKTLLKKLSLRSQIELARLYSGFQNFGSDDRDAGIPFERKIIPRPNGRQVEVRTFGPAEGRPVLFFHDTLYGLRITRAIAAELRTRELRLICVCRPGFASSTGPAADENTTGHLASETLAVLDKLGLGACPGLAHTTGLLHAFALATHAPTGITSVTAASGLAPLLSRGPIARMDPLIRGVVLMARYAPELLPFWARARMAVADSVLAKTYLAHHAGGSAADLNLLDDPEICAALDRSRDDAMRQGYRTYTGEMIRNYADWTECIPTHSLPVTLVHGDEDSLHPPEAVEAFRQILPCAKRIEVPGTGHLLFYDRPGVVFDALEASD